MEHYDVIIVGARPAGAATAMLLARAGHRVLVLDRMRRGSDTLSTHALMRTGVLQLERWGLLDRLVAEDTPAVRRVTFHYGARVVPVDVSDALYAPRRTVLDRVLADAAERAGAHVRFGVTAQHLLKRDGRVVGVRGVATDGSSVAATAPVVVGADGRTSFVARAVGAPTTSEGMASSGIAYAYWDGIEVDGYHWSYVQGSMVGLVPTNAGRTCVFVLVAADRFDAAMRADLPGAIHTVVAGHDPAVARLVAAGRMVSHPRGFPGIAGWLRRPYGPGWALVGDAGYFKDPATAHGITDALRDAELLARALDAGLTGAASMREALRGYERTRDALSQPLFDATEAVARFDLPLPELQQVHLRLSAAMQDEARHMAALPPFPPVATAPTVVADAGRAGATR